MPNVSACLIIETRFVQYSIFNLPSCSLINEMDETENSRCDMLRAALSLQSMNFRMCESTLYCCEYARPA